MSASLAMQYVVIALAVLSSAGYVVQKQWPEALRAVRVHCAMPLLRDGRAPWLRSIGRIVAPAPRLAGEGGCGGCDGCGPAGSE
jgi:hypothetical protein